MCSHCYVQGSLPPTPLAQVTKHASVSSQEVNVALMLLRRLLMSIGKRKEKNPGLFSQLSSPPYTGCLTPTTPQCRSLQFWGWGSRACTGPSPF